MNQIKPKLGQIKSGRQLVKVSVPCTLNRIKVDGYSIQAFLTTIWGFHFIIGSTLTMILTTVPWSNSNKPTSLFLSNNWKDWKASNDWQPTKIKQRENYLWINLQLKLPVHFRPLSVHGQVNYDWDSPMLIPNFSPEKVKLKKKETDLPWPTVCRAWKLQQALYASSWL